MAENCSKLADQIPFWYWIYYKPIELVSLETAFNVVNRLTDLKRMIMEGPPVQDIDRFLGFLKKFSNIVELVFNDDQHQELFDRLPEHCAVQALALRKPVSDLSFLFRFTSLNQLKICRLNDIEFIRKVFQLKSMTKFKFYYANKNFDEEDFDSGCLKFFMISIDHRKQFVVRTRFGLPNTKVPNLDAAIRSVMEKAEKKGFF